MFKMTPAIWIIAGLAMVVLEMIVPGLIIIWFGIGAIAAGLVALLVPDPYVQFGVFVVVSGVLVVFSQRIARRISKPEPEPVGANRMSGAVGTVIADIAPPKAGRVKVGGDEWLADSSVPIAAGSQVKVKMVSGTRLVVEPVEERSE
jgi:membrane protein implicated in regulation of membrane protease activity